MQQQEELELPLPPANIEEEELELHNEFLDETSSDPQQALRSVGDKADLLDDIQGKIFIGGLSWQTTEGNERIMN